jgi:hypothetical protein
MAGEVIAYNPHGAPARQAHMLPANLSEASRIAEYIAESGLFGCKTKEQAFALMLLADAEGLHPAAAARDYHIIDGKPSLRADAMLARYMSAGGKIKWLKREPECVSAEFTHPSSGTFTVTWDRERATLAKFWGKPNWTKHPLQMLSARVISEGVRASFPGIVSGVYTPEEVQDFEPSAPQSRAPAPVATPVREAEAEYVEEMPASKPAAPVQTMSKGAARGDYGVMVEEMRRLTSTRDLKEWGKMNAERVKLQPKDWQAEIRKSYQELMEGLQYAEQASADAEQELEDAR